MAVKRQDWELSPRGLRDTARHREKIKESIQKNIADIISETPIITRRDGRIVKVPVRGLKSYRFLYKRESEGGAGLGHGDADKGDIIGRQPIPDRRPGQPGDQPGIDYLETEIDMEDLVEMMLQDMGLPNLKKKASMETAVLGGWKFEGIEKRGPIAHLDRKRTLRQAMKRTGAFLGELMRRTGRPEDACRTALAAAGGDLMRAEEILRDGGAMAGEESPITLFSEDLRYRTLERDLEYQSNAVILAMMDVSGSMGIMKKYLARSFFFWLVEFLRQIYHQVRIRFIAHTTVAKLVEEEEFFHKAESGGTLCHSAYDLAADLVQAEYSPDRWNIYPFHFSDGEDFEPRETVLSARRLLNLGINMLGYGEIQADPYSSSHLMDAFERELRLERKRFAGTDFELLCGQDETLPFLGALLKEKSHVYLTLKEFLRKERSF
jgi:hypothetical protein